ncbi:hypothetical protein Tco_0213781 [Tanacetum coccineum]
MNFPLKPACPQGSRCSTLRRCGLGEDVDLLLELVFTLPRELRTLMEYHLNLTNGIHFASTVLTSRPTIFTIRYMKRIMNSAQFFWKFKLLQIPCKPFVDHEHLHSQFDWRFSQWSPGISSGPSI